MISFDVGDTVRLRARFTDESGNPVDPSSVSLRVRRPNGETITPAVTRESAGNYRADVVVDMPGVWHYRWEASGGAEEGAFFVRQSAFG